MPDEVVKSGDLEGEIGGLLRVRNWERIGLLDLAGVASRLAHLCSRGGAEWMSSKDCGCLRGFGGDFPCYLRRDSRPLPRPRRRRRIRP